MPNIKSAKKRVEVNERDKAINKAYKSELATALKKYNNAVSAEDKDLVKKLYPATVSLIDESVTRGIIHKNKADRKKADVTSKYIAIATAKKKKAEPKAEVKEEKPAKVEEVKAEEPKKVVKKTTATAKAPAKKTAVKAEKEAEAKPAKTEAKKAPAKKAEAKTTAKAKKTTEAKK